METFHAPPERCRGGLITLDAGETHHLSRVARLRKGDELLVADGCGTMYRARLDGIQGNEARCAVEERISRMNEPARNVTLVQAVLKNPGRMDWIVEKAVELGVNRILPMRTERCIHTSGKTDRWREIARAAMKQCRRCRWPEVEEIEDFRDTLHKLSDHSLRLFHESSHEMPGPSASDKDESSPIAVFIGPEGGFTDIEVECARAAGAIAASLGPRRLRSETAAIVALARIIP